MQNDTTVQAGKTDRPTDYAERLPELFAPDILVASQHADRHRPGADALGPERRLMQAVMEDAVHVYRAHAAATSRHHRALFEDAEAWIESDACGHLFDFLSVCDHLGLEAGYLRRGLRAHKARIRQTTAAQTAAANVAGAERWPEAEVA